MPKKEEELTEAEEQEFQMILKLVLKNEGGYSNNKNDRGGKTNYGITQNTYNNYQKKLCQKKNLPQPMEYKSVRNISYEEVQSIYRQDFYIQSKCHKIKDVNTRFQYFDMVVNFRPPTYGKICQKALNFPVEKQDAKVGKDTLAAINSGNQIEIQTRMTKFRKQHYYEEVARNPNQQEFLRGWLNRTEEVEKVVNSGVLNTQQNNSTKSLSRPSTQSSQKQVGGIDLNINIEALNNIKGINKFSAKFIKDNKQNINLQDLATVLRVYNDPYIPQENKHILFSLDPVIIQNQAEFKEQEKVCWPDKFLNRNIIQDTDLASVLFESDYLMKLMSLGVSKDGQTPFQYPQELRNRGLKPTHEFSGKMFQKQQLCRFWLVPDSCTYSYQNDKYTIDDIKVICESRQVERIQNELKDKISQDPNDSNYQFAQKFTELYDLISQYYPVFKRLKQVFKAVVLGKWMYQNRIQLDQEIILNYIKQHNNYPYKIPIIKFEQFQGQKETPIFHTYQEKIQIAKESLIKNGHQTTQQNIDQIIKQIPDQKGVQVQQSMIFAMGGIDPNCKKLIEKQPQENTKCKTYDDIINQSTDDESDIPFIQTVKCKDCSRNVENSLVMLNQTQCSIHNDYTCYLCLQLITKEDLNPKGLIISGKQYGFHSECLAEYQKKNDYEEY